MCRNEFGHFKHCYFFFAAKDSLQFFISNDVALVGWILKILGLDIFPDLLGHFSAWQWCRTDDFGQDCRWCHRLHERSIWFAGGRLRGSLRRCFFWCCFSGGWLSCCLVFCWLHLLASFIRGGGL